MTNKKCPLCNKVKGKRGCLLNNNALICSQCCAQIRNADCDSCSYYKEAEKFNIEKAKKSPQHFVARIDPDVDDKIDRALQQLEFGNAKRCEQMLNVLYGKNSDLYTMHFALGTLYSFKGDHDRAIESFDKSLAIYPYNATCWFNRMTAAQQKCDIPEIVFSARKVIELGEPSDNIVINAKDLLNTVAEGAKEENGLSLDVYIASMQTFKEGFALMQNKQWQAAIEKFEQVTLASSHNAPPFGNLGICYMKLNKHEMAFEMFNKAIAIDPYYEPAIINKAMLEKQIEQGVVTTAEIRAVQYSKDYSIKEGKLLIDDYIKDKL
jgi:tetratricopeptide (TPR) repeat protein